MRFDETHEANASQLDFIPRAQRNQAGRLVAGFAIILLGTLLVGFVPALHRHGYVSVIMALVVFAIAVKVISRYQKNLDLVMNTEFQNLLFTQGMGLGCTFSLFARRDGTIIYATDGMYRLLGSSTTESQMLDAVFERGGIPASDRERILGAIYSTTGESLLFTIPEATDREKKYVMTVEPLARPRGHVMVRVREFHDDRAGRQSLRDIPRSSNTANHEQLLGDTPIGFYATDAYGQFTYVNQAFARMLGYAPREMVAAQLTLANVLLTLGERTLSGEYTVNDFSGDATLRTRSGSTFKGLLFQTALRDDKSKILSATGSLIPSILTHDTGN